MMDNLLQLSTSFISAWKTWGVAIAFAVTTVTTFWVFFDSQRYNLSAGFWRLTSLLAALVVTPNATLRLFPHLGNGFSFVFQEGLILGGITATILSLVTLLLYTLGLGVHPRRTGEVLLEADPLPAIASESSVQTERRSAFPASISPTQRLPLPNETLDELIQPLPDEPIPLAWLVVMSGMSSGQVQRLADITDIGREAERNDLSIDDPTLSRQHARIRWEQGEFVLYDLVSANGVLVNGELTQRTALHNGDRIVMGQTLFGFMQADISIPAEFDYASSQETERVVLVTEPV
ncbi:MAG: FHA domain-containing protein [Chloroflexi bacterium]|nr:FHA domain-containing protein [Chloroflexota bacterium]